MAGSPAASKGVPLVSVVIPARNAERTLSDTLESLISQTLGSWEAAVVDDGSEDGTARVADAFADRDPRIRVLRGPHLGVAHARNEGARTARARWILPLDADDMLLPNALHDQLRFIAEHPGRQLYSWGVLVQWPDGRREKWVTSARHPEVKEFTLAQLVEENLLMPETVISADVFRALGGFRDEDVEDYDLWLRALAAGARHLHNPQPLAVYRLSQLSRNADPDRRELGTARVLRDLASSERLSGAVRRKAIGRARYWEAVVSRRRLEARLARGDAVRARRDYCRARVAYGSRPKWLGGLVLMTISPRMFARWMPVRESPRTNVTIADPPPE